MRELARGKSNHPETVELTRTIWRSDMIGVVEEQIKSTVRLLQVFFFQAEDGIRDYKVTGVQTCALPIWTWCEVSERRRPASRIPRRAPWRPRAAGSGSSPCTCRTGAPRARTTTSTSSPG